VAGLGEKFQAGLAKVANLIPESYRLAFTIVISGGLITGLAWLVMRLLKLGSL